MTTAKYKVFIGCSTEARTVAQALRYELRDVADAELWSQGLFQVGGVVLDELVKAVDGYDFGVFVFRPDDIVTMRKKEYSAVRDNVVFELGVFMGKLGPKRSLFVVPSADDQLRLPSDLGGIIPARYDSENPNPQKAVAGAAFELSNAFRSLGSIRTRGGVLYDSKRDPNSRFLQGRESYLYKDDKRVSDKAEASLSFGPDGLLTINRRNNLGRFEIHFRPQGPGRPSFLKTTDAPPRRSLRVSCEIKAEGAAHKVRFVAKDEENDVWLDKETKKIEPGDWNALELHLWLDPTRDFLFRIDDEDVETAPASLAIRNLVIEEAS